MASTVASGQTESALVSFSTGVEYSSGTYGGTDDLEEMYVPLTMRIDNQRFGLRLTVPYLRVDFPVEVDPVDGPTGLPFLSVSAGGESEPIEDISYFALAWPFRIGARQTWAIPPST